MEEQDQVRRIKNLTLAGILVLVGFVAVIVILSALLLGLWLDGLFGQNGIAVVCLLVASAPVSLFLMTTMTLTIVRRIQAQPPRSNDHENEEEVIS